MKFRYAIFHCFILHLLFSGFLYVSCNKFQNADDTELQDLKQAYYKISYTKNGLEYPRDKDDLERCRAGNVKGCIEVYQSAQEGKETMKSISSKDAKSALEYTLNTISAQCDKKMEETTGRNEDEAIRVENECLGSITALFFFNQEDQDKIISDRLLKQSNRVLSRVASRRFEWFYNRPDPERWIAAIENLPDDKLDSVEKSAMIKEFKKKAADIETFGVMF